jgi:hypothetical protein
MLPLQLWPGYAHWKTALAALVAHEGPLWIFGEAGTGVSTLGRHLADLRQETYLDDAERLTVEEAEAWLAAHPRGVLMAHHAPEHPSVSVLAASCLAFRVPTLDEDPSSVPACLAHFAQELGLEGEVPSALGALPCPGNFRGLHNRLQRWKLLGQLPEPDTPSGDRAALPITAEDLATNLHALERLLLHRALRRSYGNRVEAARRLGVSRRQLYLLIERHGDPLRGEAPTHPGPRRLLKQRAKN